MKSIKAKVVILVIVCAIVSTSICGGMSYLQSQQMSDQNARDMMDMQCQNYGHELNMTLRQVAQSVDTLAQIAEQSLDDVSKFQSSSSYVNQYTEALRPIALQFANNTEGALTYYIRYNPEFTEPDSGIFASRSSAQEEFEQLTPTDFSSYDPSDVAHVGWYYIPVQNGTATWMDPYLNANINVYMISYVVPIYVDGISVGIVGMDVDFGTIENMTDAVQMYDTGYAFLVNGSDQVMYHKELEFGTALAEVNGGELSALDAALSGEVDAGSEISYRYGGVKKTAYYQVLENGMKFVLAAPQSELESQSKKLIVTILMAEAVALLFAVVVGLLLSRGIVKPVRRVTEIINKNAGLNLKKDDRLEALTKMKDETGAMAKAVASMEERLRSMVTQLDETGRTVLANAEQISESSREIGEMCSDNSATTQELAAAMEEAADAAENINRNIGTVNDNAREIKSLSENGEGESQKVLERAQALSARTQEAAGNTRTMYEQVRREADEAMEKAGAVEKINELTGNILKISSQTNMLALNASIEAARAGEAGRGFTVVAEQIGSLASQTQNTVKDIEDIILEVNAAVKGMTSCLQASTDFLENTVLQDYGEFQKVGEQYAEDAGSYQSSMQNIAEAIDALAGAIEDMRVSIDGISQMTGDSARGISLIAEKTTDIVQKVADEETMVDVNRENAGRLKKIVENFEL